MATCAIFGMLRTRFVLMTPGCRAFAVLPEPARRFVSSLAKRMFASFDCPYAFHGV